MSYLQGLGFEVKTVYLASAANLKTEHAIPEDVWSCHTVILEDAGYIVEGHLPVEMIDRLLAESPEIDGIALPGMPAGTPGMSGRMEGTLEVFAFKDGLAYWYATIDSGTAAN